MAKKAKAAKTAPTPETPTVQTAPVANETQPATPPLTAITPVEAKAESKAVKGDNVKASKSTVEKPTKAVWAIANEMKAKNPQATRKEIVDECIRRGVAYYTARTQYQRWSMSNATPARD